MKRLQPAVLIPATIVAAGCLIVTIQATRFDRRLMEALSYHAGNDLRATLLFATEALQIGPFDTRAHLLQAKGYQATAQYARAIEAGREGLRYHPHSPELLGDLGTSYALKGDLDAAEAAYRRSLTLAPSHYQIINNLGGVAQQRGDLTSAIDAYREAIGLKTDYLDAWSNLGLALISAKRPDEAVQAIEQAIALAPSEPSFYYDLGDAHSLRAGDPIHAMKALGAYRTFLQRWQKDDDTAKRARNNVDKLTRHLKASKP